MRPLRIAGYTALAIATLVAVAGLAVYLTLRASLPQLDGEVAAPTLQAAHDRARRAGHADDPRASRRDLAFATGYAHGQDRFFQMDLMRRAAAGELAELLGKPVLELDEKYRIHDFRRIAQRDRAGQRRGRSRAARCLRRRSQLRSDRTPARGRGSTRCCASEPVPWRVEDSVLVAFSMYLNLNDSSGAEELARAQLREVLPRPLYRLPVSARYRVGRADRRRHLAGPADSGRGRLRSSFGRRAHGGPEHATVAGRVGRRAIRRQQQLGRCGYAHQGQRCAARQRHASELATAAHLVSRALDRRVRRRGAARSGRRDVTGSADADRRQQRPRRVGLHEQLRRLLGHRRRRDRSAGSRALPDRRRLRAVRESRRDDRDPRRQAGVPRRAEHALGTDRRLRRRGSAARARLDGARSARDESAHARLRDRDERRGRCCASRTAPAGRCRT